jgi:hypothetical protein
VDGNSYWPGPEDSLAVWWTSTRKRIPRDRRKAFDMVVILVVWCIWLERNNRVFRNQPSQPASCIDGFGEL